MKRKGLSADELLELQVQMSGFIDANEVIQRARSAVCSHSEIVLWLDEVDCFEQLFYPMTAEHIDLVIAQQLWNELLAIVYHEKGKLIACAHQIIRAFGGTGSVLDVRYDQPSQRLIWKVHFTVD